MNFKQISAFVNLGATLNYQAAIQKSSLTEVESLEKELAVDLIERDGDTVRLTALGETLLPFAQQIEKGQAAFLRTVADFKQKEAQEAVKFATIPAFENYQAATAVARLTKKYKLTTTETADPYQALHEEKCDIAFFRYSGELADDDIELLPVGVDRLAAYIPARNPVSQNSTLSLVDLKAEKFLTLNHQNPFATFVQQACSAAGFEMYSVFEGEKGKTLVNMVALGMGVTLLMEQAVGDHLDSKVVKVPIVPEVTQYLAFARLKDAARTPEQESLWQELKNNL